MFGKIKYSYIPKSKAVDGIMSSLAHAMKNAESLAFMIIDNSHLGFRLYPSQVKNSVIKCEPDNIKDTIVDMITNSEIDVIIVNGFEELDLDSIKNEYCDIVKENEVLLCVNKFIDLEDVDSNISMLIEPEIADLNDEEWEQVKEEILENLEDAKNADKDENFEPRVILGGNKGSAENKFSSMSDFLELFNLKTLYNEDEITLTEEDEECDIEECYTHTYKESDISIAKNIKGEILIDCNDDYISIPKEHLEFLLDSLKKLV